MDKQNDFNFNPFGLTEEPIYYKGEIDNENTNKTILSDFEMGLLYYNGSLEVKYDLKTAASYFAKAFEKNDTDAGLYLIDTYLAIRDSNGTDYYKDIKEIFKKLYKIYKKRKKYFELADLIRNYNIYGLINEKKYLKYWKKAVKEMQPVYKSLKWYGYPEIEIKNYNAIVYDSINTYMSMEYEDAWEAFFDKGYACLHNWHLGHDEESRKEEIFALIEKAKVKFPNNSYFYIQLFKFLIKEYDYFELWNNEDIFSTIREKFYESDEDKLKRISEKYDINAPMLILRAKSDLEKAIEMDDDPIAHLCLARIYRWAYNGFDLSTGKFTLDTNEEYTEISHYHAFKCLLNSLREDHYREINCFFDIFSFEIWQFDALIEKYTLVCQNYRHGDWYEERLESFIETKKEKLSEQ